MADVVLIPTGKMEHAALATALSRLFRNHDFAVRPPESHLVGFTSRDVATLRPLEQAPIPTALEELAKTLVNAIFPGRRGEHVDFAYVLEDVELCNQTHPERVLRLFRDAVNSCIQNDWPQQSGPRYAEVRKRCSFHLFRPMTEAYFFGDPESLRRARVQLPHVLPGHPDFEHFRTADQAFLNLAAHDRIADMPQREFHPKAYLHYLCDPTLTDRRARYRETVNGVRALESLDWERVLREPPHCPFLHAFLDDLGQALNSPLPFIDPSHADPRTRFPGPKDGILRNL